MGYRGRAAHISEMHKVAYTLHNLLSGGGIQPCGDLIHEQSALGPDDHLPCRQPAHHSSLSSSASPASASKQAPSG